MRFSPITSLFAAAVIFATPSAADAQFLTPTVDGTISTNEYGSHTDGLNQQTIGGTTWYMTWDNTNLYIGITGANVGEGAVLYVDYDPTVPVTGGTSANGTLDGQTFDRTVATVPFRADYVAYFKSGYNQYQTRTGSNSWNSAVTNALTLSGSGTTREISIPWSTITGGARPASFNWYGYVGYDTSSSNNGVYGAVPPGNPTGAWNVTGPTTIATTRYYTVNTTTNGSSTKPFANSSYTYRTAADLSGVGALTAYDFTMDATTRKITRAATGAWQVGRNFVVNNGQVDFGTCSDGTTVTGDLIVLGSSILKLSTTAGANIAVGGNYTNSATITLNDRLVTFNGSTAQLVSGVNTFGRVVSTAANLLLADTVGITTLTLSIGSITLTTGSLLTVTGAMTVDGSFNAGYGGRFNARSTPITGSGSVTISSDATLALRNTGGIDGLLQVPTRVLSTGANYIFDGSQTQVTGVSLPTTVSQLYCNNPNDVYLSADCTVTSSFGFATDHFYTQANRLTLTTGTHDVAFLTVNSGGALYANNAKFTGVAVEVQGGATLETKNPAGVDNQFNTTFFSLSNGAHVVYDGTLPQVTGENLVSPVDNLTINNPAGVKLSSDVQVTNQLALTSGELNPDVFSITAPDTSNGVIRTTGYVIGSGLIRELDSSVTGPRPFPVGTVGNYAPVTVDITAAGSGTGQLRVSSTNGDHPNVLDPSKALNRYWTLEPTGISGFTATLTFQYPAANAAGQGTEANYVAGRYLGAGQWQPFDGTVMNTTAHTATVAGVTGFSDWTLGERVAVPVSLRLFGVE